MSAHRPPNRQQALVLIEFPFEGGSTDEPCRLGRLGSVCRLCRRRPVEAQPSPPQPSPTDPTRPSPAQTPRMESKLRKKHLLKTLAQNLSKNLLLKALAHNLCVRTRRHAASIDAKLQPSCLRVSQHRASIELASSAYFARVEGELEPADLRHPRILSCGCASGVTLLWHHAQRSTYNHHFISVHDSLIVYL